MGTFGSVLFYSSLAICGLAQIFTPSKVVDLKVISFNEGASIKLSRAAPPVAAMEDVFNDENEVVEVEEIKPKELEALMSSVPQATLGVGQLKFAAQVLNLELTTIKKSEDIAELSATRTYSVVEAIKKELFPAHSPRVSDPRNPTASSSAPARVPQSASTQGRKKDILTPEERQTIVEDPTNIKPTYIEGEIELAGGLAFLGGEQDITVFRVKEDRYLEQGQVRTHQGRFSISVEGLSGKLVAEIKDADGNPYGRGEFYLEKAIGTADAAGKIHGVKIKLYNSEQGISGKVLSAYSFEDKEIPVVGARVAVYEMALETATDENGRFQISETDNESMIMVSTTAKKYWPSLSILTGGQKNEVKMFPEEMVNALMSIVGGKMQVNDWKKAGIIWGQVKSLGKPVAGAKVELAGASNLKPIYFNGGYFPDLKKEVTGSDGYFVYLGVTSGVYQVRASLGDRIIDGGVVQSLPGYLSYLELKAAEVINPTEFRIRDLFDPESDLSGQVKILGTEQILDPKKETVDMDYSRDMIFVEAVAAHPYSPARMSLKPQDDIEIPMINEDWLNTIVADSRRLRDPSLGTVLIAFSQPIEEIYINGQSVQDKSSNVVFFDQEGKMSVSPKNLSSGGALLLNLPLGLQNISVRASGQAQLKAKLIISDPGIINVFSAPRLQPN